MRLSKNVGFGAGHNIALFKAQTPYVLVLNQDVVLEREALARLMAAAQEHGDAAALGPCLLRPGRPKAEAIIDTAGLQTRVWGSVFDRGSSRTIQTRYQRSGYVWGISGACLLLKREAVLSLAYARPDRNYGEIFDETFFMYKEDVDLGARLRTAGWKVWYEAEAIGTHGRTGAAPASLGETRQHRRRLARYVRQYSYRNHWFFLIKNAPLWQWPLILPYEALKFVFILFTEPTTLRLFPSLVRRSWLMLKRRYA
jgi:GT2 family glycosyltransferase